MTHNILFGQALIDIPLGYSFLNQPKTTGKKHYHYYLC